MCNLNSYFPILAPHLSTISPMDHGMQSKSSHASTDSLEIQKKQAPSSMLPSLAACEMSGTRWTISLWEATTGLQVILGISYKFAVSSNHLKMSILFLGRTKSEKHTMNENIQTFAKIDQLCKTSTSPSFKGKTEKKQAIKSMPPLSPKYPLDALPFPNLFLDIWILHFWHQWQSHQ